jgi:tRNA-dihydrouridine synthase 3
VEQYPRPITDAYLKEIQVGKQPDGLDEDMPAPEEQVPRQIDEIVIKQTGDTSDQNDTPDVPVRFAEKKRLHWTGKTCEILSL